VTQLTESARVAESDSYSARHLSVLEGLDAVRKRPGMYIGSTDGRGLQHCLWEIFDNAVDEALGGFCSAIAVILHADGSAEVRDNGRGIPVDNERKTKLSGVELVLTRLHAGGKFGGGSYTASGGLHGVGASVVNALSARLDIEVDRTGQTWATSFRRGVAGEFAAAGPAADFSRKSGLRQVGKVPAARTGTRIRFWPDRQVFLRDATFSYDLLAERCRACPSPSARTPASRARRTAALTVLATAALTALRPARPNSASTAASASSASTSRRARRSPR
jgi:DNA gyrase subunit B